MPFNIVSHKKATMFWSSEPHTKQLRCNHWIMEASVQQNPSQTIGSWFKIRCLVTTYDISLISKVHQLQLVILVGM